MADNFNARLYARGYASSVVSRAPTTAPMQPNICAPACTNCGLLECLCRPRFFAGQLLTEQDLNRLDYYIRAKNRMHNLQLHGWGVVNGLQVRCDSCGSGVIVGAGYAIDPCGEDIVVCNDTPVDICALIKRCQQIDVTCVPSTRNASATTCDDVEEDWVLAIRYSETQARSVVALRSTPSCACGGKGGGCSCCGTSAKAAPTPPRTAAPECEATAICEGYAFDAFLAPVTFVRDGKTQLSGGLIDTFECCYAPLKSSLPQAPTFSGTYSDNADAWTLWCCRTKEAMIGFFSSGTQANCTLVEKLQHYSCPVLTSSQYINGSALFQTEMTQAVARLRLLLVEAVLSCLCTALLPPAPCGTSDDRIPLAIVTVRKRDCKVLRVCNWTSLRKLVLTAPTLDYWFGWIPLFSSIQDLIGEVCCTDLKLPPREVVVGNTGALDAANVDKAAVDKQPPADNSAANAATMMLNPTLDNQRTAENQTLATLIMNAFTRGNTSLDPAAFINGAFGFSGETKLPLTDTEKANIGPFLLLHQLAQPIAASVATTPMPSDQTATLASRVAVLEKAIAALGGKTS